MLQIGRTGSHYIVLMKINPGDAAPRYTALLLPRIQAISRSPSVNA
jgi:hypothetical protein